MMRHQRLVGAHNVLAIVESGVDHSPGNAVGAADQLDDDIDLRIRRHRGRVLVPAHGRQIHPPVATAVASGNRGDDNSAAGPLSQELSLPVEQLQSTGSDRPQARDGDLQRRFHNDDGSLRMDAFREVSRSLAVEPKQAVYVSLPYLAP